MGLVYKAKDSRLGREVALKVLPEGFSADPERLARFEREAKVLASQSHPTSARIYAFEKWGQAPISAPEAGAEPKSVPVPVSALVMGLVEGPMADEASVRFPGRVRRDPDSWNDVRRKGGARAAAAP